MAEEITIDFSNEEIYEKVLFERARVAQFMARNELIWGKGFVASESMYNMALELGAEFNKLMFEVPPNSIKTIQYKYLVLNAIYGRACQQFCEITFLMKAGFADGAYARWRSIYELQVIAEYISQRDEKVAKAYYDGANVDDDYHDWAKIDPVFAKNRHVTFDNIKKVLTSAEKDVWRGLYKLSNKVVHASPQKTFSRLGTGPDADDIIPVGHSDYGLAMPAVNSAIMLSKIATYFFNVFPCENSYIYIQIMNGWSDLVRKHYAEIEKMCFDAESDNTETLTGDE